MKSQESVVKEDVTFFVRFNNNETIEINTMNAFTTITVKHCNEDMIMFSGNTILSVKRRDISLFLQFKIIYCQLKGLCTEIISNKQRHFKSAFNMGNHWK